LLLPGSFTAYLQDCFPDQPLTAQQQAEIEQLLHPSDQAAYDSYREGFDNAVGGHVKLRDYHLEALQLLIRHFSLTPQKMPGTQWTMGLGKSVLIAAAACLARTLTASQNHQQQQQQQQEEQNPKKVLILVPSTTIRQQLAEALRRDAPPGQFGDLQPQQAVLELGPELDPAAGRVRIFADGAMGR
jgi:superfamily II DNA or RNA helicase